MLRDYLEEILWNDLNIWWSNLTFIILISSAHSTHLNFLNVSYDPCHPIWDSWITQLCSRNPVHLLPVSHRLFNYLLPHHSLVTTVRPEIHIKFFLRDKHNSSISASGQASVRNTLDNLCNYARNENKLIYGFYVRKCLLNSIFSCENALHVRLVRQ